MSGDDEKKAMRDRSEKLKLERSHLQGIVRGHINKINKLLLEDNVRDISACEKQVSKLTTAQSQFAISHDAFIVSCAAEGITPKEQIKSAEDLSTDAAKTMSEASEWIIAMSTRQAAGEFGPLESTSIYGAQGGSERRITFSSEAFSRIAGEDHKDQQLRDYEYQLDAMKDRVRDLERETGKVDDYRRENQQLHESLSSARSSEEHAKTQYCDTIRNLQQQLHDMRSTDKSGGDTATPDQSMNRSVIGQEELFAISHVMQQSSRDMMKDLLDHSMRQQRSLFTNMRAPQVELLKFDGNPIGYCKFINRFDELIGSTEDSDSIKLTTLLQHCAESVLVHLDCCNYKPAAEGYRLARTILKMKYGNPYIIAQSWVDKLTEYPKLRTPELLQKFSGEIKSAMDSLRSLGFLSELECTKSLTTITAKLPNYLQNRWRTKYRESMQKGRIAKLKELVDLIENAADEANDPVYGQVNLERISTATDARTKTVIQPRKKTSYFMEEHDEDELVLDNDSVGGEQHLERGKKEVNVQRERTEPGTCFICKGAHYTSNCFTFIDMSSHERLRYVIEHKLCLLCLGTGHRVDSCSKTWVCRRPGCQQKHNGNLHQALTARASPQVGTAQLSTPEGVVEVHENSGASNCLVLETNVVGKGLPHRDKIKCVNFLSYRMEYEHSLPVVPVFLKSDAGWVKTNALIDTGSTATIATQQIQEMLKYTPIATQSVMVKGIAGEKLVTSVVVNMEIRGLTSPDYLKAMEVTFLDNLEIAEGHVDRMKKLGMWSHLRGLKIPQHDGYSKVDVLIGQDNAHLFKQSDMIDGVDEYGPYAVKIPLGWTVFGHYTTELTSTEVPDSQPIAAQRQLVHNCQRIRHVMTADGDQNLEKLIELQWRVDQVPDALPYSPNDKKILAKWESSIKLVNGHWEVPIPYKNEPPHLRDNYNVIKKKLEQLGRRLEKRPDIKAQYVKSMRDNFDKGYAKEASRVPYPGYEYYHPHQEVITPRRPGKCRIVGNLSFVCNEESLNTSVYQGPDLTTPLVEVLVQFRLYRYAFTTDIAAMYNQVVVPKKHRDSLRFLWWKDDQVGGEIVPCQMTTHMFGGVWCPSATSFALQHTARVYGGEYDEIVASTVLKNFYVDDLLKSIMSIAMGLRLISQLRDMLSRVGFSLAKFGANDMALLSEVPKELLSKAFEEVDVELTEEVQDKTLGTTWGPKRDVFGFSTVSSDKPCTRRGILSTFSSVYDPLGFVAPFVLRARQLIQELCAEGYGWDEALPQHFLERWSEWTEDLARLPEFTISRWLGVTEENRKSLQIHAFSDASEKGYGVVLYLCVVTPSGEVTQARLLMAKARVSPIKPVSIPRLELVAAVLSAKMVRSVTRYIDEKLLPAVFWIDSMIVLYYIRQQAREFRTFVANRVAYIHDLSEPSQWMHVPGELNVADKASRGIRAAELIQDKEWVGGPEYLFSRCDWPVQPAILKADDAELKKRLINTMQLRVAKQESEKLSGFQTVLARYSEWVKMVRALGYFLRLVQYCRQKTMVTGQLTGPEFEYAELVAVRLCQRTSLTRTQLESRAFVRLFPFDDQGVQRVGGRLMMSQLRFEERHPAILPVSQLAEMYVRYIHIRNGHVGVARTFMEVRRKYWLMGGKSIVKKVIGRCLICKKIRGRPGEQIMSPLPSFRVEPGKVPFENVGIDYAGPMLVKRGRVMCKRWICVITCFAIRAVHLEMAFDLTTSSFLSVLQRFIARRGRPTLIVSDNGTNFVGAVREMKQAMTSWNQAKIGTWMMEEGIEWQFNTPTASHHGGAWERMIRTYRELTMAIAGQQTLTDESAMTYLCNVEQIMNSRPLCRVSEDPQEELPITPNHLLMVPKTVNIPGVYEGRDGLQRRWKQTEFMADQFWQKWVGSYLKSLQERTKWVKIQANFQIGDLVLLTSELTPRLKWPLGLVIDVFPGIDGRVRSVRVKTKDGVYERPITKLVRLECEG